MTIQQQQVLEFHRAFKCAIERTPGPATLELCHLRMNLIVEEAEELTEAFRKEDTVGIADALADLLYVLLGTAVTCGIDLDPVFAEVHRSNMTKLWTQAEVNTASETLGSFELVRPGERCWLVKRADGKVLKSPSYEPARIAQVLAAEFIQASLEAIV